MLHTEQNLQFIGWWSKEIVAVVTGANKGIDLAFIRRFAELGLMVVLTARDESKGKEAMESLKAEGLKNVEFCQLDVTNPSSITAFVSWIQQRFGGLDILVNNAGVSFNEIGRNSVEHAGTMIKTNFYGSKTLTEALISLFRRSGSISQILNISSQLGLQTSEIQLEEKSQKLKASASCIEDLKTDPIADTNL